MTDNVNHPAHYESNGPFECIELAHYYDFCVGNAIKYVWRHMDKGKPFEDLSKALWYISWEIDWTNDTTITGSYALCDKPIIELEEMNFVGMAEFWTALEYRDLAAMRTAIEHRAEALTADFKPRALLPPRTAPAMPTLALPDKTPTAPQKHGHVRAWRQGEKLFMLRGPSNSLEKVSKAMRQRGFDWDSNTIRRIEQGERRIHLDEAIALLETYGYTQANMFTAINYILKESVNNECKQ